MPQLQNHNHRDLVVWKNGIDLARSVYRITTSFPVEERYGLTSQMRRSAVSVPANIAEGAGRGTAKELLHYLYVSRGSLCELETLSIVAQESGILCDEDEQALRSRLGNVSALLNGLIAYTRSRTNHG